MEHPFPIHSAPCQHLEPPANFFKLLKMDKRGLFALTNIIYVSEHYLKMLPKYEEPLLEIVCTLSPYIHI